MDENSKVYNYTWDHFSSDVLLCTKILPSIENIQSILAVSKGGLPLGTTLANMLSLPLSIVEVHSYSGRKRSEIAEIRFLNLDQLHSKVLVVDDVSDSGATLAAVSRRLTLYNYEFTTFTLCYKPHSIFKPDLFFQTVTNDTWINFAWETTNGGMDETRIKQTGKRKNRTTKKIITRRPNH